MVILGLLMTVVFYGLGKTDFEDRVYWWTLSAVAAICGFAAALGEFHS